MKRLFLVLSAAVVILPWLAEAKAQADAIHWTASGSPLGSAFIPPLPQNVFIDAGIGLHPGNATSGTNSGSIIAIGVSAYLNPDSPNNAFFGGPSANYSLSLALHDDASGAFGSLIFRGNLSGEFGEFTHFTNTFLGPTTETLKLGQNLYTVTIGPFVPPSVPDGTDVVGGSVSASIAVQPVAVQSAPEPSSLVLACLGLPSLGLARWLRRRKGVDPTT